MDRPHSTLELVKFDETARAPERDWDATAFELDTSASAPQVSTIRVPSKEIIIIKDTGCIRYIAISGL